MPDVASPDSLREQSGGAQAVTRALSVLARFRGGTPDLGVSDIARMLDLTTSTTHRLVRTLVNAGFLERDPRTSRYRLRERAGRVRADRVPPTTRLRGRTPYASPVSSDGRERGVGRPSRL